MTNQTVLYVCEDVPVLNTAGHTTYINAFLASLLAAGYDLHVLVTGNHFPLPIFRFSVVTSLPGIKSQIPQAWRLWADVYIAQPLGVAKWAYRRLFKPLVQASKGKRANRTRATTVHIGRWLKPVEAKRLAALVADLKPEVVFIDTVLRSPVLDYLPASCKSILVGHDIFHQRCLSLIASGLQPLPCVSLQDESKALHRFDALIGITEADAAIYAAICSKAAVIALPSPIQVQNEIPARLQTQRIFYLGSQGQVNVDGLSWFLGAIWPSVKAAQPALVLDVVGSVGAQIHCQDPDVHIHGRVDDFSGIAQQAMFAINPVRAGSGLKIKMIDYFAHGLGCITTAVGAAGFPQAPDSPIAVCDDASAFTAKVLEWSNDLDKCNQQSDNAKHYVKQFSEEGFGVALRNLINRVTCNEIASVERATAP